MPIKGAIEREREKKVKLHIKNIRAKRKSKNEEKKSTLTNWTTLYRPTYIQIIEIDLGAAAAAVVFFLLLSFGQCL